ncbi:MAG: hydrogenase [Hamadaea sp.]|nr:hydrogenase [Hamadaea sp.]
MTTTLALAAPAAAPLLAALLALVLPWRTAAVVGVAAAVTILAGGVILATRVTGEPAVRGLVRADALTTWMLIVIGAVATLATASAIAYLRPESAVERRRYLVLTQLFLGCMSMAVLADNLGLLWVAIEATTIVTAFLVGHRRTRESVEAAWKYVVLCSVGVAIAFLGTVCIYAASVAAGGSGATALNWSYLTGHTAGLDPALVRLATGLILLGFGTKAGLAPLHAWLPDAHSQAPAPVSALMSGVLLSVAFYAILRYKAITDAVIGPAYTRILLIIGALASLAVAAILLIAQRDYKRMLAYSSIEHMGLIALGAAFGVQLAMAAVLLHVLGHGLAKSVAFCASGRILTTTGSPAIAAVRGMAARHPSLAATFGVSAVALLGLPPFSLFASELGIARGGFAAGHGWIVAVAFTLMLIAFAAIARHVLGMLLGPPTPPAFPPEEGGGPRPDGTSGKGGAASLGVLAAGLAVAALLGVWLGPLADLLDTAAAIATGGR